MRFITCWLGKQESSAGIVFAKNPPGLIKTGMNGSSF